MISPHKLTTFAKLVCLFLCFTRCEGIWSWLFSSKPDYPKSHGSSLGKLVSVPFEMRTADEKFLLEAQKYGLKLSDLDLCHHKVIMELKKSCASLTEEDIGKLSVSLLNCQSAVEGRPTYTCTEGMSLRECTQDMDQTTWNSYHIVSNRARAVCYASRQQQFTAKTEMTVNKLVFTAEHQLDALKKLELGQSKVQDLTNKTLSTMASGQQDLMVRQERLKLTQQQIHSFISGNLRELTREKRLIAAGQKELADMTEAIKNKLDVASQNLQKNEQERQNNHMEIIRDLQTVHTKAKDVWEKLENSTERIMSQHSQTASHYKETLENLKRINNSINYLMNLLDQTRSEVDMKLGWLTSLIGGAGDQLQVIYCLVLHGIYLTVGAIIAAFLQVSALTRVVLLVLVSGNALLEVKHSASLDFMQMTTILLATLIGHWMINMVLARLNASKLCKSPANRQVYRLMSSNNRTSTPMKSHNQSSNQTESNQNVGTSRRPSSTKTNRIHDARSDESIDGKSIVVEDLLSESSIYGNQAGLNETMPEGRVDAKLDTPTNSPAKGTVSSAKKDLLSLGLLDLSSRTLNASRSSTPTRRSSSSSKKLCNGVSKTGAPCRATCTDGKAFCHRHIHQKQESEM